MLSNKKREKLTQKCAAIFGMPEMYVSKPYKKLMQDRKARIEAKVARGNVSSGLAKMYRTYKAERVPEIRAVIEVETSIRLAKAALDEIPMTKDEAKRQTEINNMASFLSDHQPHRIQLRAQSNRQDPAFNWR